MSDPISITLAAGADSGRLTVGPAARVFVDLASVEFTLQINDTTNLPVNEGSRYTAPDGEAIRYLKIVNTGAETLTARLIVTDALIERDIASAVNIRSGAAALGQGQDIAVAAAPVRLVTANDARARLNIWAGSADLWIGSDNSVQSGTIHSRIPAGALASLDVRGEVWAVRATGPAVTVGVSEEVN